MLFKCKQLFLMLLTLSILTACMADTTSAWAERPTRPTPPAYIPIESYTNSTPYYPLSVEEPDTHDYYECETETEEFLLRFHSINPNMPRPKIALTFDDGPIGYTNDILDLLEEHGGRATFCVLGYRVENWADTVNRTTLLGSEVIGHSWTHRNFATLRRDEIEWEILATKEAIEAATNSPSPRMLRVPFGVINDAVLEIAEELEFALLQWSVDTRDWHYRCADHLYHYIMENATHGAIIVLHDIHPSTMEAMTRVIPELTAMGFQLVTASELINEVYGHSHLVPGTIYRGLR